MPVENDLYIAKGGLKIGSGENLPAELSGGVLKESQIPSTLEKIANAEATYVSRSTTAFNLLRDFGAVGDAEQVAVSMNSTSTLGVGSAKASWVGKVICGEGIPRGTTVLASVESATSIVVSKSASITSGEVKINIGTDNSAAFELAEKTANERAKFPPFLVANDNNKIFQSECYVPAGKYIITKSKAMMNASGTVIKGLKFTGSGKNASTILFAPSEENAVLMKNNQALFEITFEHMTFMSVDSTASWMESIGPTVQNYSHICVDWRGEWKYGEKLSGTNNNSEFIYVGCGIYGSWNTFLFSPSEAEGGSDQFLNYWFFGCSAIQTKGGLVDMASGGSVEVVGGNIIPNGSGTEEQNVFRLRGSAHGSGVCRFNLVGARTELRHAQAKIIDCEWSTGIVSFKSYDCSSVAEKLPLTTSITTKNIETTVAGSTSIVVESSKEFEIGSQVQIAPATEKQEVQTVTGKPNETHLEVTATSIEHASGTIIQKATRPNAVQARFRNVKDLIIKWDTCMLPGIHQYDVVSEAYKYRRTPEYVNCGIVDHSTAKAFILNVKSGNEAVGNRTPVAFERCKGNSSTTGANFAFDTTVNWDRTTNALPKARHVSIKNTSTGCLPSTASGNTFETINLPVSAVITRVRSWKGSTGSLEATNWEYKLADESNSGATVVSIKPGEGGIPSGRKWKEGWNYDSGALFLRVTGSPVEWILKLTESNVTQQQEESFVIVEYIS